MMNNKYNKPFAYPIQSKSIKNTLNKFNPDICSKAFLLHKKGYDYLTIYNTLFKDNSIKDKKYIINITKKLIIAGRFINLAFTNPNL